MKTLISKKVIKPAAKRLLYECGFFDLLRQLQINRVIILMYHRFSGKTEPFKISARIFEQHLRFFRRKYSIISLNDYVQSIHSKKRQLPPNPLIITIDDGYQDAYFYAYPLLKKYDIPATIFLTTDFISQKIWLWSNLLEYILKNAFKKKFSFPIGNTEITFDVGSFQGWHRAQLTLFDYCCEVSNEKKNELLEELSKSLKVKAPEKTTRDFEPLTWNQIREMGSSGMEYGSHSCTHPIMSQLDKRNIEYEVSRSKSIIERETGVPAVCFCYPNGRRKDFNDRVIAALHKASYLAAVTTITGFNSRQPINPYLLKRNSVASGDPAELSKILTTFKR